MIRTTEFSAALLLGRIERRFDALAARRGLELRVVHSTVALNTDAVLLAQVLDHVVANAISYTVKGRVLVGCRRRDDTVSIEVWDTGPGLAADQCTGLAAWTGPREWPSADGGCGLLVVHRLTRMLRLPLQVAPFPGGGTRFAVLVPLAESARPDTGDRRPSLVVIDDEEQVLEGLRMLLEAWHFDVVAAGSEKEAVALLQRHDRRPVGIIADYRLRGGRTGAEAVNHIRRLYKAAIPSIIITGDTTIERLGDAHATVVLHKPVTAPYLHTVLAETLKTE